MTLLLSPDKDAGHYLREAQRWDWLTEKCVEGGDLQQAEIFELRAHNARMAAAVLEGRSKRRIELFGVVSGGRPRPKPSNNTQP